MEHQRLVDAFHRTSQRMHFPSNISYSVPYRDEHDAFRHVQLPEPVFKSFFFMSNGGPTSYMLSEPQWRGLGLQMSEGWRHCGVHAKEPHILLFRMGASKAIPLGLAAPSPETTIVERLRRVRSSTPHHDFHVLESQQFKNDHRVWTEKLALQLQGSTDPTTCCTECGGTTTSRKYTKGPRYGQYKWWRAKGGRLFCHRCWQKKGVCQAFARAPP